MKALRIAALCLLSWLLLSSCSHNLVKKDQDKDMKNEVFEAVCLSENSYWVLKAPTDFKHLKDDLIVLEGSPENAKAGERYAFTLGSDLIRETYPPQADGASFEKLAGNCDPILTDMEHGLSIAAHLPTRSQLIDVRTAEEYAAGHLPGSVNIDVNSLEAQLDESFPAMDEIYLVYCRSGRRSAIAAGILKERGCALVFDLGGIQDYRGELEY